MNNLLQRCENCANYNLPSDAPPCNDCSHITLNETDHWAPKPLDPTPSDIKNMSAREKLQLMRRLINHAETVKAVMVSTGAAQLTTQVSADIIQGEGLFRELYLQYVDEDELEVGDDYDDDYEEEDDETNTEM